MFKRLSKLRRFLLACCLLFGLWFFIPRQANMEDFDPARMGRLESDMWRHYYDKSYARMAGALFLASHGQYGFSPWDSLRMAWHAAQAARRTQPTQPRAQAFAVGIPPLTEYYRIIQKATGAAWQPEDLAPMELEWWVQRRENATWQQYGETIARLTARAYDAPLERVRPACLLRAEMMDYRDQRRNGLMTAEDWQHITTELGKSWALLKTAVTPQPARRDP
ncbi:hypothetical protein WJU23_15625 [Prosthecobacter sp. SYSU 5D2]|uniref:hypothetical protein n=1 Tax=Prosthecobacter sp. SYSU 5D2 TaxID=3134134 RepID=UPI0031FE8484